MIRKLAFREPQAAVGLALAATAHPEPSASRAGAYKTRHLGGLPFSHRSPEGWPATPNENMSLRGFSAMHHEVIHYASLCAIFEFVTISLRNLPSEVEKAILEISRREGLSLNKATLRLLEGSLRKPVKNSDFEEFCGTWSSAEADAFDATLADMRQVDPQDWESAG